LPYSLPRKLGACKRSPRYDKYWPTKNRSLLREFGHILPIGVEAVTVFAKRHLDGDHPDMPDIAHGMLGMQCYQFIGLNERIAGYSKMIEQHALLSTDASRLMRMQGIEDRFQ